MEYPMALWDSKLQSKLDKGYVEIKQTAAPVKKAADLKITDREVKSLISFLMKAAKTTIEASYQVPQGKLPRGR